MFRIIRDYIYAFIGLAASIITLVLFADKFAPALSEDGRVAIYFIGGLFVWFFIENVYLKVRWGRERRYAQILDVLADGFGEM